jgi:hypothetical protein
MTEDTERRETPEEEDVVVLDEAQDASPPEAETPKRKPVVDGLDPEDADYGAKVQKRIGQLAKQRREAEATAERERARAEAAERALFEVRKNSLTQADASYKAQLEQAQDRQRRAFADGDGDALAQTSAEMAEIAARRAEVQREARQPAPQQQAPAQRFTPKTQAFLDDRPHIQADDPIVANSLQAIHAAAQRRGLVAETPEYFRFAAKSLDALYPESDDGDDEEAEAPAPKRSAAPPVVAAARRTAPGTPPATTQVRLTAAEREICERNGWDLKAYASAKLRRANEGNV